MGEYAGELRSCQVAEFSTTPASGPPLLIQEGNYGIASLVKVIKRYDQR